MKKISDMDIIAHRGGHSPFVENTLEAFLYSLKIGFKALEMDVRYAYAGKVFFLEHDFLHHPRFRKNIVDNIFPHIPEDVALFIELKTNSVFTSMFAGAFTKVYDRYLTKRRSYIISFNPVILFRLKHQRPEMKIGFICGSRFLLFLFQNFIFPLFLKPDLFVLNRRILNKHTVRFGKKHGMKIYSYVINRNEDRHKALDLDIDGIVTDYPL